MVKYSCEKCGKEFSQKGHYTQHINKKNPCVHESKIKEMVEKVVAQQMSTLSVAEAIPTVAEAIQTILRRENLVLWLYQVHY